jgi:hypothetical protein
MYNPETALGTIQRTKTNKTKKQNTMLSLDCTFLITPFVLFVFVLGIVPNAVSGLHILDYPFCFVCLCSLYCAQCCTNKTKGVIKNVQSRDSIGHNTKNKDKQNKRGYQECTIQRQHWPQYKEQPLLFCLSLFFVLWPMLSLDCTFLITPFVLFVFVLCIVANAVSGLYILDNPPFVLFCLSLFLKG